jgi:hypothetical protein
VTSLPEGAPPQDALTALELRIGAWMASVGRAAHVGLAAANALAAGHDTPHLRELAGANPADGPWDLDPVIEATLEELGRAPIPRGSERAKLLVVAAACVDHLDGLLPASELTRIAHEVIGHEGPEAAQDLVELDDEVLAESIMPFGRDGRHLKHEAKVAAAALRYLADLAGIDQETGG